MAQCACRIGEPNSLRKKSDRIEVVDLLDATRVFQLRESVPLVAERLGHTQKIYNCLAELGREGR